MSITTSVTPKDCEYVLKLKDKLSFAKRQEIIDSIKASPLLCRAYENDGNTWYELRPSEDQNYEEPPDATLLIESDFIYIVRKKKSVPLWQDLDSFQHCIEDDIEFMTEGAFYSCMPSK